MIADHGALAKLAPKAVSHHSKPKEVVSSDGATVSIACEPPERTKEFLEGLLPPLAEAEMTTRQYALAETHLKRLIGVAKNDGVGGKVALMAAYWQYAELLRRTNRKAEANEYQHRGDDINKAFIPM